MSFLLAGAAVVSAGVGIAKAISSGKKQKAAERKEAKARAEMDKQKAAFAGLDTSNPFMNMENTMEDLTVNQKEAEMVNQQGQQQRANIMGQMKGMAGGSGVAALAQQMANSGQLASQKSSALIGNQEAANQKLERGEASRLQGKERDGEVLSRNMERDKTSTLLGMAQSETAGFADKAAGYEAAKWDGITQVGQAGMSAAGSDRNIKKNINKIGESDSGLNIYSFEYIDKSHGEGLFQGVMSDEVPPEAVVRKDGYDSVYYDMLDVEFKRI
tara:strand:- start:8023 stop:8838 length:816 start_codon:yes stop_codon:yes gene_type:complete